jgi:hypothetical protein
VLTHAHKLGSTEAIQSQLFGGYIFETPSKRGWSLFQRCDSQGFTLHTVLSDGVATVGRRLAGVLSVIAWYNSRRRVPTVLLHNQSKWNTLSERV